MLKGVIVEQMLTTEERESVVKAVNGYLSKTDVQEYVNAR